MFTIVKTKTLIDLNNDVEWLNTELSEARNQVWLDHGKIINLEVHAECDRLTIATLMQDIRRE